MTHRHIHILYHAVSQNLVATAHAIEQKIPFCPINQAPWWPRKERSHG